MRSHWTSESSTVHQAHLPTTIWKSHVSAANDEKSESVEAAGNPPAAEVIAFVDEAGLAGYVHNLTEKRDQDIGLMCALPLSAQHVEYARESIRPLYERFCAAAPEGAKLHITDAFAPGNDAWRVVAVEVREQIFAFMLRREMRIVYAARRAAVARATHNMHTQILAQASAAASARNGQQATTQSLAQKSSDDKEMLLDRAVADLALVMGIFMEIEELRLADFHFDQIDEHLAERYMRRIERTQSISFNRHEVKQKNPQTGREEVQAIERRAQAGLQLGPARVGKIVVAGKTDPLVFAVDVVANSLWRHLKTLPADAPLHAASSLARWPLEPITFYDRREDAPPSVMDLL